MACAIETILAEYAKRPGTSGIRGHLYETKLLSLIYFRAIHDDNIEEFHLATNVDNIGSFDDICFRVKWKETDKPIVVFIQVKHRENNQRFTLPIIDLVKYFKSYLEIKRQFHPNNKDVMFKGETKCLLVIYTTAKFDTQIKTNDCQGIKHLHQLIGPAIADNQQDLQLPQSLSSQNKSLINSGLTKIVLEEHVTALARLMAKCIFGELSDSHMLMQNEFVIRYHVILAQKVFDVSEDQTGGQRNASFRKDFFNIDEEFLLLFKDELCTEILKRRKWVNDKDYNAFSSLHNITNVEDLYNKVRGFITYKNGKFECLDKMIPDSTSVLNKINESQETIRRTLELAVKECLIPLEFKVPAAFGNKDLLIRGDENKIERKLNDLTSKIVKWMEQQSDLIDHCVFIDKSLGEGFLQHNGGIASAIGNLLISSEDKTHDSTLKFNHRYESLGPLAKRLFDKLLERKISIFDCIFKVRIEIFPKCSFVLINEGVQKQCYVSDVESEFVDNLLLYTSQRTEQEVEETLMHEINKSQSDCVKIDSDIIFLKYHDAIQKWWMTSGAAPYLTKEGSLYKHAVKHASSQLVRTVLHRDQSIYFKVSEEQAICSHSEEEKEVLRTTSNINNNCFPPIIDVYLTETLKLSSKQAKEFDSWVRPDEICTNPEIIVGDQVDCFSIKQTIVSNSSFVASLCVSALHEKRFNRRILTSIIYPKNMSNSPVYNPFGEYMIMLHLNGVRRRVIIDDRLPYSKYGRLLCSYSSNKNEFWVSLLEKAYMKVMGGYDFGGSNSNIDLHALTGWIPERLAIRNGEADFNADAFYEMIRTRLEKGDVLVTVATGPLSDAEAERMGLVARHAFAVLDVKQVCGVKLLMLKNPWSHLRWRGNYSELDVAHWTPTLRALLNYDPDSAAQYDNGVFWIDYDSILKLFDVFYVNWNPEMFQFTYCIHQKWDAGTGPAKDAYNIGENPQFSLHVQGKGAVWLLLTRHITHSDDFRDNKEYITLLVYKNGRRVYYPYDLEPYVDDIRINSPHYLCKLLIGEGSADRYTVVVSQYEKSKTIFYTLRAYATCPFTLSKLEPYPHKKTVQGEWTARTAGGCENHRDTYPNNPKFIITVPDARSSCNIVVELKGPKQYQMGVDARVEALNDPSVSAPFLKKSSGPFRAGFVVLELRNLPAGRYILTPSTFYPGQEVPFFLELWSTCPIRAVLASPRGAFRGSCPP